MAADDDEALQPERTGLAWVRTLVAVAGTWGLVAFHAFHDHGWQALTFIAGGIAVAVLVTAGWIGSRRGRQARDAMAAGMPVPGSLAPLALTASAVVAAVVAFSSTLVVG